MVQAEPVKAVAVSDLKVVPMPNGPARVINVVNGNTTTDAFTTQKHWVGNGPATESEEKTPSYPVKY